MKGKKFLGVFLALAMICTMLPTIAFAAEYSISATYNGNNYYGAVYVDSDTVEAGSTAGFTVQASDDYSIGSVTVTNDTDNSEITLTDYGTGFYEFTMPESNVTITVVFKGTEYSITVKECTGGTVTASAEAAESGSTITLTYAASENYAFKSFYVENSTTYEPITVTDGTFTMPSSDVAVSATFIPTNGTCGENATWAYADGTLTISGTGDMTDYTGTNSVPWYEDYYLDITSVVIEDGITSVGDNAFCWCENIESVTLPDSVTEIGKNAFYQCSSLVNIDLPDGITTIGSGAFMSCSALTSITLGSALTSIAKDVFPGCSKLTAIYVNQKFAAAEDIIDDYAWDDTHASSATVYWLTDENETIDTDSSVSLTNNSNITVTIADGTYDYTGSEITPEVTVTNDGVSLTEGIDYTVSYEDNIKAGTATVKVTGITWTSYTKSLSGLSLNEISLFASGYEAELNGYSGEATGTFTITLNNSTSYADNAVLSLVPVTSGVDGEYYITLSGEDSKYINRFLSAQLKFVFDEDDGNGTEYDITKIGALTVSEYTGNSDYGVDVLYEGNGEYVFKAKSDNSSVDTIIDTSIILGVATITGVGSYSLNIDTTYATNQAHGAETANNIVSDFYYNASAELGDGSTGNLFLDNDGDDKIPATGEVDLDETTLTINVVFPNTVSEQKDDYTSMTVKIDGLEVYSDGTYEYALGTDTVDDGLTDQTITYYTSATDKTENILTGYSGYTIADIPVYVNRRYDITIEGAGYRTCYTSVIPTDKDNPSTVTVWNNVMDSEYTIITTNDDAQKLSNITFLAGDICKNGIIDLYDLSAVVSYFGKAAQNTSDPYSEMENYITYDLNRDGKIDSKDIAMVLVSWGK